MKLSKNELIADWVLGLLTSLEALCIDLYLRAFQVISEDLNTDIGKV